MVILGLMQFWQSGENWHFSRIGGHGLRARRCRRVRRHIPYILYPSSRRRSMSEHIHHVTDDTFEPEVLQAGVPVLVDYWAEWCGPCKMIAPILDEVAREYAGKLKVAKLNIDDNQATPPKYGIRGIPTLMIFKNGSGEATKVGALSKSQT